MLQTPEPGGGVDSDIVMEMKIDTGTARNSVAGAGGLIPIFAPRFERLKALRFPVQLPVANLTLN